MKPRSEPAAKVYPGDTTRKAYLESASHGAARPEVASQKRAVRTSAEDDLDAYSIAQFCQRHGIAVATFYKFRKKMPKTFRVGGRVLISREAAAAWRAAREQAA